MDKQTMRDLKAAGQTHRKTVTAERRARRDRDRAITRAVRAGMTPTQAARAAGVSRHTAARAAAPKAA